VLGPDARVSGTVAPTYPSADTSGTVLSHTGGEASLLSGTGASSCVVPQSSVRTDAYTRGRTVWHVRLPTGDSRPNSIVPVLETEAAQVEETSFAVARVRRSVSGRPAGSRRAIEWSSGRVIERTMASEGER